MKRALIIGGQSEFLTTYFGVAALALNLNAGFGPIWGLHCYEFRWYVLDGIDDGHKRVNRYIRDRIERL